MPAEPASFGFVARERLVIRDDQAWRAAWAKLRARVRPQEIDFTRSSVILVAMGGQPSGGYVITIDAIERHGRDASVSVSEEFPGCNCVLTQAGTYPVAWQVVPAITGEVTFVDHRAEVDCR